MDSTPTDPQEMLARPFWVSSAFIGVHRRLH
jgi:hypothetical protein